ncbi:hypothetical protein ACYCFK_04185 [Stutzerimonas stutzeri]|uniref:hypothetical protein n=1 Tax=Stutzerimonas stutzeri TaxID=316 RepID=UPI0015E441AA|nr:hypothetical protein [Stutzerimonas stutzeri]MBA1261357.1 hypothetical protein [Stutzerimonas stutzeri]
MNKSIMMASVLLLASTLASADEVVSVQKDRAVGGGFGGLSGFMLGAAAGGPIGALVGAGVGYFAGQGVQDVAGLEHNLYVLKDEQGNTSRLRTSADGFEVGQRVERDGSRLAGVSH